MSRESQLKLLFITRLMINDDSHHISYSGEFGFAKELLCVFLFAYQGKCMLFKYLILILRILLYFAFRSILLINITQVVFRYI